MGRTRTRVWSAVALVAAVIGVVGLGLAAPAGATRTDEQITDFTIDDYKVELTVAEDGVLHVVEQITVNFSGSPHHGIERFIRYRYRYDDVKDGFDRLTPIDDMEVSGSPGTPVQVKRSRDGDFAFFRIGDKDREISGVHTYRLDYSVRGTINHFKDHDELAWNVVGTKWPVPIAKASATLTMPATIDSVTCYAGPELSTLPCTSAGKLGTQAAFGQDGLGSNQAFTVVASIAPGAIVPTPTPILDERWTVQRAFAFRPDTVAPAGGLVALAIVGLVFLGFRVGRDRRYVGGAAEQSFGNADGRTERVPLFDKDPIPVEYAPPDDLRPGQVGTLIDEQANTLDVTATVIDLAVRGYLRITEVPKKGLFGHADWTLTRLEKNDQLKSYERTLLTGLFSGSTEIELSDLKDHFHTTLVKVKDELYDDTVKQGWFTKRPDSTGGNWLGLGVLLMILGVGATIALTIWTSFAIVGVALTITGIALFFTSTVMPARTAKGHATYRRILGFKQFIDESEKERAQFAERENLFSEYLPYAVVFGATEKWARAFAGIGGAPGVEGQMPATAWYVGPHPFTMQSFGSAMDSFATSTSGTLASVPASSGSSSGGGGGFSGGGFGGGGGGAW